MVCTAVAWPMGLIAASEGLLEYLQLCITTQVAEALTFDSAYYVVNYLI